MRIFEDRTLLPASIGMAVGIVLLAGALARAIAIEPPPPVEPPADAMPIPADPPETLPPPDPDRPLTEEAVQLVADADPFMQNRERAERYLLPSQRFEPGPEAPPLPPAPPFRLYGTAVVAEGGLAVMQVEDETPQVLTVGDWLQGYRLASVQPFKATMEGQGRTIDVPVTAPLPHPEAESTRGRGRGGAAQERQERARELMRQQLMRQFEQLRERGAPPEVLEELMQRINEISSTGNNRLLNLLGNGAILFGNEGREVRVRLNNRDTLDTTTPTASRQR